MKPINPDKDSLYTGIITPLRPLALLLGIFVLFMRFGCGGNHSLTTSDTIDTNISDTETLAGSDSQVAPEVIGIMQDDVWYALWGFVPLPPGEPNQGDNEPETPLDGPNPAPGPSESDNYNDYFVTVLNFPGYLSLRDIADLYGDIINAEPCEETQSAINFHKYICRVPVENELGEFNTSQAALVSAYLRPSGGGVPIDNDGGLLEDGGNAFAQMNEETGSGPLLEDNHVILSLHNIESESPVLTLGWSSNMNMNPTSDPDLAAIASQFADNIVFENRFWDTINGDFFSPNE